MSYPATDFFAVYLSAQASKTPIWALDDDPACFTVATTYSVYGVDDMAQSTELGEFTAHHVKLGAAVNAQMPWVDIMQFDLSLDLDKVHALMFEPETEELSEDFLGVMGASDGFDVVYVQDDHILDAHWGPHVLRTLVQHSDSAAFVVVNLTALGSAGNPEQAAARGAKLHAMGFTRYSTSPFYFLNCAYRLRELPSHLTMNGTDAA